MWASMTLISGHVDAEKFPAATFVRIHTHYAFAFYSHVNFGRHF